MVDGNTGDHSLDMRLDRRLKRRMVSIVQCKNFRRKNVNTHDLEERDPDYRKFLNSLPELVDSSDENVETKLEYFGHYDDANRTSRCNRSDEKDDPVYKMFFQHLTEEGKYFKLELPSVNGVKVYVKYEEEEQSSPKNDQDSRKRGTTRILSGASRKEETESPAKQSVVPLSEEDFGLDCEKPIYHGVDENSSIRPGTCLHRSAKCLSQSDSDTDLMDEDYKTFLQDFLYDDDQRLIYMPVDGRSIVYEDDESMSDSEVEMMDSNPCTTICASSSFGRKYFRTTMDIDSGKCLQSPGICTSSNFRERLIKFLKRPYDENEYNFFLEEVSRRKAHVRHRELRSGALKAYTLESRGKSYLRLYGELAVRIQSVQYDCPRTLNLLRGFFFWLQNLSHEDAFQPWMDPSCLDVLPRS